MGCSDLKPQEAGRKQGQPSERSPALAGGEKR